MIAKKCYYEKMQKIEVEECLIAYFLNSPIIHIVYVMVFVPFILWNYPDISSLEFGNRRHWTLLKNRIFMKW